MDKPMSDVMIHIDENLQPAELKKLEDTLRQDECVISAGVPASNRHMLLVAYNPDCASAVDILSMVERSGVHAELVGM